MPQNGFSDDGYIIDQDYFSDYPYRGSTSNINGCGWVAAFDLLRAQGQAVSFREVLDGLNSIRPAKHPGPTPVWVLRQYLAGFGAYRLCLGRRAGLRAACQAPAGILRYWEGRGPHFIPFLRQGDGHVYRFLNVADGLEDMTCSMEEFFAGHCRYGFVRVIVPKDDRI
ncbi:MAG: hypothetical protein LUE21_05575 [Oscillospiraceae bacterium]|nr:hypothetical protein [Oscillospiraceae bacterium]